MPGVIGPPAVQAGFEEEERIAEAVWKKSLSNDIDEMEHGRCNGGNEKSIERLHRVDVLATNPPFGRTVLTTWLQCCVRRWEANAHMHMRAHTSTTTRTCAHTYSAHMHTRAHTR